MNTDLPPAWVVGLIVLVLMWYFWRYIMSTVSNFVFFYIKFVLCLISIVIFVWLAETYWTGIYYYIAPFMPYFWSAKSSLTGLLDRMFPNQEL
jgi:hypothetical protein